MVNKSLGLIEVVGLAAAIEAADAAIKAANIQLMGYELTKGGGLVLVKICGDVGAVTVGVHAGSMAASKVSSVLSTHVIPRPHQQLSCMIMQEDRVAKTESPQKIIVSPSQLIEEKQEIIMEIDEQIELSTETEEKVEEKIEEKELIVEEQELENSISEPTNEALATDDFIENAQKKKRAVDICNLCNDPACHRKKGDPKITCIYYGKDTEK